MGLKSGFAVGQFVEELHYKLESHGFNSLWCHFFFLLTYSWGRLSPLSEMSTSGISYGGGVKAAGAEV